MPGPRGVRWHRSRQARLRSCAQRGVIVFDGHEVISALIVMDGAQSCLVGVERIEHDKLAVKRAKLGEQLARGGDLVALGLDQGEAQTATAGQADRADQRIASRS